MVIRDPKPVSLFLFLVFVFPAGLNARQTSQTFALPPAHFDEAYPRLSLSVAEMDCAAQAQELYPIYDMNPPSGIPGRAYFVNVISHDPTKRQITDKTRMFAPGGISISDIINGPVNAGLALVYLDTIISQLTRLDDLENSQLD